MYSTLSSRHTNINFQTLYLCTCFTGIVDAIASVYFIECGIMFSGGSMTSHTGWGEGDANSKGGGTKLFLANFPPPQKKLQENERNWTD